MTDSFFALENALNELEYELVGNEETQTTQECY